MPINLKHSGNAAPALIGAYAGGEGERGAKDAPVLSKLYGERAAQTSRQASAMMSQLKESADRRQAQFLNFARQRMSERQREIDRRDDIARADAIRAENRQNFLDDRAHAEERQDALRAEELARADESARAAQPPDQFRSMGGDDAFLPQLTREEYDADREGYNRLFAQWRAVGADDGLTDDEKLAARQELSRQFYGLQTAPRPPADPTPQERFERDTFEWQGARYGFDRSGKVYQVPTAPAAPSPDGQAAPGLPSAPEIGSLGIPRAEYSRLYSQFQKSLTTTDAEGNVRAPSSRQIHRAIKAMLTQGGYGLPASPTSPDGQSVTGLPQPAPTTPEALETAWSDALAEEQGTLRPDSPAQPGVAPEPSPTSPASTSEPAPPFDHAAVLRRRHAMDRREAAAQVRAIARDSRAHFHEGVVENADGTITLPNGTILRPVR